jgi:solute carrier family 38 (sodium-coupled neutral amino acid transporter), member 1
MIFIIFPLGLLRKIQFLSYTSALAMIAILYLIAVVVISFIYRAAVGELPVGKYVAFNPSIDILKTIPIYFFSFGSHITLLPMYRELKDRSYKKMGLIINFSMVVIVAGYFLVGIFGYLMFAGIIFCKIRKPEIWR